MMPDHTTDNRLETARPDRRGEGGRAFNCTFEPEGQRLVDGAVAGEMGSAGSGEQELREELVRSADGPGASDEKHVNEMQPSYWQAPCYSSARFGLFLRMVPAPGSRLRDGPVPCLRAILGQ
jgi:hypothetical protein